ncbi:MAG TPA: ABC transporter ATP-binding protein [Ktedonobacteraceae bacterium]|nr:ABC transporter ATP-binding protein [Ktedonobacteraceae bacterium]
MSSEPPAGAQFIAPDPSPNPPGRPQEIAPPSQASRTTGETILDVRQLVKSFGGLRAVDDCSFTVATGSITGLIGPNGAGKSTAANLITGFLRADSGSILFDGTELVHLPPHRIALRGLTRTFQITRELERMTVTENLLAAPHNQLGESFWLGLLAPPAVRRQEDEYLQRALKLLQDFDLYNLRDEYAGNLSGGQRRLLELARVVMTQPKLLLLDEPFAGINPVLASRLSDYIDALCREQGITFLIIEHNLAMVERLCNTVIVMALGRTIAEGTMAELRENSAVVDAYLGEG